MNLGQFDPESISLEQKPADIDIRYLEPIVSGMQICTGKSQFHTNRIASGWNFHRTYYYVITPVDEVGNGSAIVYALRECA